MLITLRNPLKCRGDWNKDYGHMYVFYIIKSQVTLTTANNAVCVYVEIAVILDCAVYDRVHPLIKLTLNIQLQYNNLLYRC